MNEKIELKKYLLRKFFATLIFIGFAETVLGLIMRFTLNPIIEHLVSPGGDLGSNDMKQTFSILLQSLLLFIIQQVSSEIPYLNHILELFFDHTVLESATQLSQSIHGSQASTYLFTILLFFLLVFFLWALPYIIGGIYFAGSVHRKVNEIESYRIAKEKEFEKQKNLLISDMAHDIKTPITTIAGFAKALSDQTIDPDHQQQYLDSIYAKSMRVNDLISLLFDYVKLDSNGFQLKKTTEDFCELVRGCIANLYTDFEEKQMELDIQIDDEKIFLSIDRTQMQRAINNLLINSIRHNPDHTKIMISLSRFDNIVTLEISDLGVFIESDTARHLFDPFVQGDRSRSSGSGTGLGLSITKKVVEMHQGTICLIQYKRPEVYGKTKTFQIKLPIS